MYKEKLIEIRISDLQDCFNKESEVIPPILKNSTYYGSFLPIKYYSMHLRICAMLRYLSKKGSKSNPLKIKKLK